MAGFQVGSHSAIGYLQFFDRHIRHKLHDGLEDAGAFYNMIQTQREVGQLQHLPAVNGLHPLAEFFQFPCRKDASDKCAHRTTCNRGDAIALRLQFLNGTDMGKTSRTTT